ncbi:MAG: hypothetical protein A2100_02775 [Sideroxydans sp. GWF2_59_14]|nr:MAG: hypothetical protein A2100_02775 [Sideroxydans sp. GWF2_59_14]HAF45267.1 hypothetical protein [Gallionellaceae bacterium]
MPLPKSALTITAGFLVVVAALFAGYIWIAFQWSYSEGERAGFMQKLSSKGWICKTWEGELSLVALPGAAPEKFIFTVRDDAVADKINQLVGQRVALIYEQHKGLPTSCFGETEYFVNDIRLLPEASKIPGQ